MHGLELYFPAASVGISEIGVDLGGAESSGVWFVRVRSVLLGFQNPVAQNVLRIEESRDPPSGAKA